MEEFVLTLLDVDSSFTMKQGLTSSSSFDKELEDESSLYALIDFPFFLYFF